MKTTAFKNTDIGPIPEDWEVKSLDECVQINPPNSDQIPDRFTYLDLESVKEGQICKLTSVNKQEAPSRAQRLFKTNDILFQTVRPYQRNNLFVGFDPKTYVASTGYAILRAFPDIAPAFIFSLINSDSFNKEVLDNCTGTSYPAINPRKLGGILVSLPTSLSEQRRIAAALSDADELVASLDKLIEKKKRVKEGAMQRLLSGETRLPGFTGKWVEKKLGECGPFRKGHGITREESHSGSIPAIRYGELYTTHHDIIREYPSRISETVAKQAVQLKKGDILFACSGETKEEIGKSAAFVDTCEAYAGGDLLILSPNADLDSAFLGYALNRSSCVSQKAAAGQGDAVVHIREEALKEVIVSLPPTLAEQRAIAAVLSDMDEEIAALARERAEAERIKQGMMQELLTGKTRLKGE